VRLELGRDPLSDLDRPDRTYHLIVLADFPAEIAPRPGVSVMGRADDQALTNVIERLTDTRGSERRKSPPRERPPRDPSLLYDAMTAFYDALNEAVPGDVLMALTMDDPDRLDAVAVACRPVIRVYDYVLRQSRQLMLLLVGVDPAHPDAAVERVRTSWAGPEELTVVWRQLNENDVPADVFSELLGALRAA
jgi:hypothetical protein